MIVLVMIVLTASITSSKQAAPGALEVFQSKIIITTLLLLLLFSYY